MPVEIERKFLVADETWRSAAGEGVPIAQAYLGGAGPFSVRVRRMGDAAFMTIKSNDPGVERLEFEYPIPLDHAAGMFTALGDEASLVEKVRYDVVHDGHVWNVDVFAGTLAGLVLAEIELSRADEPFTKPSWLGDEVTDDPRYRNAALAADGAPKI